jgi:tRNA-specific 2-thiouridylase
MTQLRKALALISGGLDSLLAARVVQRQGVQVEGVNFFTGFCVEGHTHALRVRDRKRPKRNNALWVAEQLGIRLHIVDIVDEYRELVINPPHGYGANLNPCLDCKIFMVHKAHEWIKGQGFDFIVTGEVIGQRPMSQRRDTLPVVARDSGAGDLLLRPLCALNLPPTLPEREGWVRREELYGFTGRSRKPQIALAAELGFQDYAQPAGGCCFLTDAQYAAKLADLWQSRGNRRYDLDDILLLKVGRHLRPAPNFKLIVSREQGEGNFLQGYRKQFISLETISHPGPLALVDGQPRRHDLRLAARLVARFSQGRDAPQVELELAIPGSAPWRVQVPPMAPQDIPKDWYL